MTKEKTEEFEKLIKAARRRGSRRWQSHDVQAAVDYYLASLERSCRLRDSDAPEMLRGVIDDQIWTGIQFVSMLRVVPPECWGKLVFSEAGKKSSRSREKKTGQAEAYVAQRIKKLKLTRSTDVSQISRDIRATWDSDVPKRGNRWVEDLVSKAKTRATTNNTV